MTESTLAKLSKKEWNSLIELLKVKKTTLEQVVNQWICDDSNLSPTNLVDRIEQWLPKEQSAVGSQNSYVECSVEGYNDCLKEIKAKLR